MPIVNGAAAARTLLGYAPLQKYGHCLEYVWDAYHAHGATSPHVYPTAYSVWLDTKRRHTDRNPPAGASVWWGRRWRDGNMDGDVTIAVGNDRVAATDQPTWGKTGVVTLDQRQALVGREYLGWTEDFMGNTVVVLGAPTAKPAPASAIPAFKQITLEDNDNMRQFISLNAAAPKFELGAGTKRSVSAEEWAIIRALESAGGPKVIIAFVSQKTLDAIPGK